MKTIKETAQEMYPVENKAECYTAFLQGADCSNKQAIQFVTDILVSAYVRGSLTERELKKVFNVIKEEIR